MIRFGEATHRWLDASALALRAIACDGGASPGAA